MKSAVRTRVVVCETPTWQYVDCGCHKGKRSTHEIALDSAGRTGMASLCDSCSRIIAWAVRAVA